MLGGRRGGGWDSGRARIHDHRHPPGEHEWRERVACRPRAHHRARRADPPRRAGRSQMTILITLHDVEPAVRLNARLEADGVTTALVSPLDDVRAEIRRAKPGLIVISGDLADASNVGLIRELLWEGTPVVGLMNGDDAEHRERLRALGYVELFVKPINVDDVALGVRRIVDRRELQEATRLIGQSQAFREVIVKGEQMAPLSSTVLVGGESGTGTTLGPRPPALPGPRP